MLRPTCICCVDLDPTAPALLLSRHVLLVFRHVWHRADTQLLVFLQCILLFNALLLSVDP